ncbi:MAG: Fe-S protein assembly chaperone HscA, partial [Proteobacteria bacterium]|nr:Fe-S protein assembly chaperone HscA [Pseudomonadota bacterium]
LMGRGAGDLKQLAGAFAVEVANEEESRAGQMVRLRVGGRVLTPVEVSADILRALKRRAETALGRDVTRAVVTVPAYFDEAARAATKDAAKLAGLEVLRLIGEPTAAALAYGLDTAAEGLFAVYDLGGGTFDISILRMEMGVFQVIATGGDAALGGDDFDHLIAEHFLAQRAASVGKEGFEPGDVKMALATARLAKECLTTQSDGEWVFEASGKVTRHALDRDKLDMLLGPLVDRTIELCRGVLADAELDPKDLKGVVLVGGSTRVPLVRRRVEELFGQPPLAGVDPDEVVALGAALQAEALTVGSDALLLDVTPLSLGVETMGGLVEKVIPRNSPIPVARAQEFTTYQDGQSAMMIHVVQGERELTDQCRSLARFELSGIPAMTAGAARILVTYSVDADGLLTVSAREKTTGVEQEVAVKPSYGLGDDDMANMLRESMEHAREDMTLRLLVEARVEAERAVLALESALAADGDLLSAAERREIEARIDSVRAAVRGEDRDPINTRTEELNEATQDFAARRMDRGIRAALTGVSLDTVEQRIETGDG